MASYDEAIPPGQVGNIKVELKTDKYRGPVEKAIQVTTNDPEYPSFRLTLKANIVVSAEVLPNAMLVLPHPRTWDPIGRLVVHKDPTEPGELKITNIKSPMPWLKASARKVEVAEPAVAEMPEALPGDWILELKLTENAPVARSRQEVTFETGLKREPMMHVTVGVEFSAGLVANPQPLPLRLLAGESTTKGVIKVLVRPDLVKQELKASVDPGPFSVALARADDRHYEATVTFKQGTQEMTPAQLQTKVLFALGTETLSVPVFVRQRVKPPPSESGAAVSTPGSPKAD